MKFKFKKVGIVALSALALSACGSSDEGRDWAAVNTNATAVANVGTNTSLSLNASEKTEVLGLLEKYAVENNLTGISLFENGGYQMFASNVTLGTETYVSGYGFGTLREGSINADLEGETNAAWKRYYHTFESEDPGHLNYMDDKGSVVGGLVGYANSSYFDTKLSDDGTAYEWVGSLAKQDRPEAVNAKADGTSTTFRFEVKVGSELVYNTKTTNSKLSKYAGRAVKLEDYLTPYKLKWCQKIGYARAAESLTSSSGIAGSNEYYNGSKEGINEDLFDKVGVKAVEEAGKSYLEFTLNEATTPFMAMYYLSSSMFAPVPMEFIEDLGDGDVYAGAAVWGKKTTSLSPVDTTLSTGPYVLSSWTTDQEIVWDANDRFVKDPGTYTIPGIHVAILKAQATDNEAALKEFLANKLSSVAIPTTRLSEFKNDPRTKQVTGDSVFKLNVNSCDKETWESLFGVNGSICQTQTSDYWDLEPAMSNKNFLLGLSYSINRTEFADKRGSIASVNYFSSNYLIDPENGISYNSTNAHAKATASLTANGTVADGYSLTLAQSYFKTAAEQLIASGAYSKGDKITLEICWMYENQVTNYGADIKTYFEKAFNDANTGLTLEVTNTSVANWSDVYYNKMMVGQYDLAFGSISGNTYDPLNFLEVLRSDNSSGFTLNWGTDTNTPAIDYKGKTYSFDALWQAADTSCLIDSTGAIVSSDALADAVVYSSVHNSDGTRTVVIDLATVKDSASGVSSVFNSISNVVVKFGNTTATLDKVFDYTVEGDKITFTLSEEYENCLDSMTITVEFTISGIDENGYFGDAEYTYTKDLVINIVE